MPNTSDLALPATCEKGRAVPRGRASWAEAYFFNLGPCFHTKCDVRTPEAVSCLRFYQPHYDSEPAQNVRRAATVLVYLEPPEAGARA